MSTGRAPIRFGIIGLDHWYAAIPFAQQVAAQDGTELVRVVDRDASRVEHVLREAGQGIGGSDPAEVLTDPSIDVVACFTSVDQSSALTIAAAQAGKHIVSVKPLALTLAEADRVVEAVEASGVFFVPSESRHTSPLARRLADLVHGGAIGQLRSGSFAMNSSLPKAWPDATEPGWWVDPARTPGGGWIDHAVYQIDRFRWLFDSPIASVTGTVANIVHHELDVEDYGHAVFTLESGAVVTVEDTWVAPPGGFRNTMHLIGSGGEIITDTVAGTLSVLLDGEWQVEELPADTVDTIDVMVRALTSGTAPHSGVREARATLAACLDFYRAAGR